MKKGIIVAITVVICAVLAATYTFANPSAKAAKTEPTTKEKEVTTTEKEKTTTEATTESKKAAIEEETSEESATDQEEDDSEEITDQKKNEPESDLEDNEEIDDEETDRCDHEWTEPSYAIDPEKGYVITQDCKKCHLVKDTAITEEEYEEATKDQEPSEEDCEYEDNGENDAEVIEQRKGALWKMTNT